MAFSEKMHDDKSECGLHNMQLLLEGLVQTLDPRMTTGENAMYTGGTRPLERLGFGHCFDTGRWSRV